MRDSGSEREAGYREAADWPTAGEAPGLPRARRLPPADTPGAPEHWPLALANGTSLRGSLSLRVISSGMASGSCHTARGGTSISSDKEPLQFVLFNKINQWAFAFVQKRGGGWGLGRSTRRRQGNMERKAQLSRFLAVAPRGASPPSPPGS